MTKRGVTKESILKAAAKVFFENGYEKTTVNMILAEAHAVTGSFYHFFASKEALFEAVTERFLEEYAETFRSIAADETLTMEQMLDRFFNELQKTMTAYYSALQADRLHWTVQYALHDRTLEQMAGPLAEAIGRMKREGIIKSFLDAEDDVLAGILLRGSEAVIHGGSRHYHSGYGSQQLRSELIAFWKRIIEF